MNLKRYHISDVSLASESRKKIKSSEYRIFGLNKIWVK